MVGDKNERIIMHRKTDREVQFDIMIKMQKGVIYVSYFKHSEADKYSAAAAPVCKQVHIMVRHLHQML